MTTRLYTLKIIKQDKYIGALSLQYDNKKRQLKVVDATKNLRAEVSQMNLESMMKMIGGQTDQLFRKG